MVAYSFKGRFSAPIANRTKKQTIRAVGRKRHARPGERITMTTGDRFHPRLIGSATCQGVDAIFIDLCDPHILIDPPSGADQRFIWTPADLNAFAVLDGFSDWSDMVAFWRATHPGSNTFDGLLISWGETFEVAP